MHRGHTGLSRYDANGSGKLANSTRLREIDIDYTRSDTTFHMLGG